MVVNLRQNKNEAAEHFGKWYPEVDTKTPLDLKGFCAHMTEHGKLADYQLVVLVVQQVVECMKELVLQGQPVKLEGLGTFSPSIESTKGGANSVKAAMDAGLDTLIEGVHMNFTPENTKGEKLTSRALKDECVFDAGYVVESVKQTVDGKVKRYQNKTPISFILSPANGQWLEHESHEYNEWWCRRQLRWRFEQRFAERVQTSSELRPSVVTPRSPTLLR